MIDKVVIIGAPRSGTNMLRDLLTRFDDYDTWPCDEINYIWRHGNRSVSSDEFVPDMATPKIKKYIERKFNTISASTGAHTIIEKTCANSLRLGFVDKLLPEAKYIFIIRDGKDTIASAMKRWKADLDIRYLMKKVRYVPILDLPYYGVAYITNRFHKITSIDKRLNIWGPRLNNINDLLEQHSLEELCALQWQRCVENTERDLKGIKNSRVYRIKYEDFVDKPATQLATLAEFLSLKVTTDDTIKMTSDIKKNSVGKGRNELSVEDSAKISQLISKTLVKHGYDE